MNFQMDKFSSISAIKDAIAGETYSGSLDVYVVHNKMVYIYKNIYVKVYYDTAYAQMCVEIVTNPNGVKLDSFNMIGE